MDQHWDFSLHFPNIPDGSPVIRGLRITRAVPCPEGIGRKIGDDDGKLEERR